MLNNFSIKNKLRLNSIIILIGIAVMTYNIYNSLNSLKTEYLYTKNIQEQAGQLKSMLIGGLMLNSAKGVVNLNPNATQAIKSMSKGGKKIKFFHKNLYKSNKKLANTLSKYTSKCIASSSKLVVKANNKTAFTEEDMINSLKSWRGLKKQIMASLQPLNKEVVQSRERFNENIQVALTTLLINGLIFFIIVIIMNYLISSGISKSIDNLQQYLESFFKFLNREASDVGKLDTSSKDEITQMGKSVENNIAIIKQTISEDRELIDEADIVLKRAGNGWFSQTITKSTSNESITELKDSVNTMLGNMKSRFIEINKQLEEYSKHNYINDFEVEGIEKNGVFDKFQINVNTLKDSITTMLVENKKNGLILDDSSDVLIANVDVLRRNASQSAVSIEETVTSIEELNSQIDNSTKAIVDMGKYGRGVTSTVAYGLDLANKTASSVTQVNTEVQSISESITVIDQIAFQTNILSLNAAVEAATAGEAGKGFAVVAQEVRNLASRSAEAASEIKSIVESATAKSARGKEISDEMIRGYNELHESILVTFKNIDGVKNSSEEQLQAINQINNAINQLDKQSQENSTVASQTHDVAVQTDALAKLIVEKANEKEFVGKDSIET